METKRYAILIDGTRDVRATLGALSLPEKEQAMRGLVEFLLLLRLAGPRRVAIFFLGAAVLFVSALINETLFAAELAACLLCGVLAIPVGLVWCFRTLFGSKPRSGAGAVDWADSQDGHAWVDGHYILVPRSTPRPP